MRTVSGAVMFLFVLCALPLFKLIKRKLSSVASYILWLIIFLLFYFLTRIGDQMTVISFFGFLGNLIGAILMKIAHRGVTKDER